MYEFDIIYIHAKAITKPSNWMNHPYLLNFVKSLSGPFLEKSRLIKNLIKTKAPPTAQQISTKIKKIV